MDSIKNTHMDKPIPGYLTSSLVAPWDLSKETKEKVREYFDPNIKPMGEEEFKEAFETLYINDLSKFSRISQRHNDVPIPSQKYFLLSFVPCRGARPDKTGTYGFMKMRGVYDNDRDCDVKAAEIIKNGDTYHPIRLGFVGRPTPININPNFCKDVTEVDISKQVDEEISKNVRAKRDLERKEIEGIQDRAKNLQKQVDFEGVDPLEGYTTLRTKKAQLVWTYTEHEKKKKEIRELIIKAFKDIHELDLEDPTLKDQFYDKFVQAREGAGIKDENMEDTFMKYLAEDRLEDIDFKIPEEYISIRSTTTTTDTTTDTVALPDTNDI